MSAIIFFVLAATQAACFFWVLAGIRERRRHGIQLGLGPFILVLCVVLFVLNLWRALS